MAPTLPSEQKFDGEAALLLATPRIGDYSTGSPAFLMPSRNRSVSSGV